jgi:hypothetical protein
VNTQCRSSVTGFARTAFLSVELVSISSETTKGRKETIISVLFSLSFVLLR